MKVFDNGVYRELTAEELAQVEVIPQPTFRERVIARVREIYSVDDELAILRQRDIKPEEFAAYNAVVEKIKAEERGEGE